MNEILGLCKLCGEEITEENINKHFLDKHNAFDLTSEGYYGLVQD